MDKLITNSSTIKRIETHYSISNLYSHIISALQNNNVDLNNVQRIDLSNVDEFHIRGASISRELANEIYLRDAKVLDVGCGIGGPCRMLADKFNCQTTGIDISTSFIDTAKRLSKLVGLNDKTIFIKADATDIPLDDNSFDVVWTQHVQMNIQNKNGFYSEIHRVLKPGGAFIYYDVFKNRNENIDFPVPWAENDKISFLCRSIQSENILNMLGLNKVQSTDQTSSGILYFENLMKKMPIKGRPKPGLNILMGPLTKLKIHNLLNAMKDGRVHVESGVFMKK